VFYKVYHVTNGISKNYDQSSTGEKDGQPERKSTCYV
jgi:hypothetical protein